MKTKSWTTVWAAVVGAGMFCASAQAERTGSETKPSGRPMAGPKADAPTTQPGRRGFADNPGERIKAAVHQSLEGVNPTDEQKTKIKEILDDAKAKMEAWRTQNEGKFKDLHEQMKAAHDAGDRAKAQQIEVQMKELHDSAPAKPKDIFDQIRGVLTDDQRKTFDANVEKVKQQMQENRPGRGGKDGAGPMEGGRRRNETKPAGSDRNKLDI